MGEGVFLKDSERTKRSLIAWRIIFTLVFFTIVFFMTPVGFIHVFFGVYSIPVYIVILILLYILVSQINPPQGTVLESRESESPIKVVDNYVLLPENCRVEYGYMRLVTVPYQRVSRTLVSTVGDIKFENSRVVETNKLDLNDICNKPFFAYSDLVGNAYVSAPGFIVKTGAYTDLVGICFNRDAIQEKTVELSVFDLEDSAIARLTIHKGGYRAYLRLDSKTAKRARLELCLASQPGVSIVSDCIKIAEVSRSKNDVTSEYSWNQYEKIMLVDRQQVNQYLSIHGKLHDVFKIKKIKNVSETTLKPAEVVTEKRKRKPIVQALENILIIGYEPSMLKARLVLSKPFKKDIVREVVI